MGRMSNKELLAHCRDQVDRSKRWRNNKSGHGFDDEWRRYISLYHGKHYDTSSGTDQLIVNLVFSTVNVMAPAVAINNPRFVVNARNEKEAPNAIITEEVLNYLWRRNEYQRDFRLAVLDWIICGHAWLKVGYKSTKPVERKSVDGGGGPTGEGSEGAEEGLDDREDVEGNVESELNLDQGEDRPFVERISIFDVFVDPDARHPKEMRWIAQRTWRPIQDVQADSRYSATARARVSGSNYSPWDANDGDGRGGESSAGTDEPSKRNSYVEVIEYYDIKRNLVGTFACSGDNDSSDGWLIKPKEIPYASGHPFVMMRNFEVPDHFYPMGDVAQIESLQLELNATRTQMLNYRKKFRRAWTYTKDAFDRDGIRALQSDEDNVMIPVSNGDNPSSVLAPVPAVITPPEFFDQSAMIQNDMDQVSGVSDYARGNPQQSIKRTATEAAMIADAANARAQDRLMKVEQFLAEAGKRVIQLMQQYMTGEQVARIVTLPVTGWVNYDKEYIQGEFEYEVRGGSTEPRNESFRRQSALQLADISAMFVEMGVADPMALYQKLLRDGFGEKDPQRFIAQQQPAPASPQAAAAPPPGGPPPGPPGPGGPPMPPGPGGPPMPAGSVGPAADDPALMQALAGGGLSFPPGPDPSLGPPPQQMTPEMLAMMLAAERGRGGPPVPPEMLSVAPPM